MSKLTGTIAFIAGLLLVLLSITAIFVKNENRVASKKEMVEIQVSNENASTESGHSQKIPKTLRIAMYVTLILSSVFVVFHVSRYGLTNSGRISSSIAFIGGILLISLGFLGTLAQNEAKYRSKQEMLAEVEIKLNAKQIEEVKPDVGHHSNLPVGLRYTMIITLFVGGVVTIIHVSRFGLA